MSIVDLNRRTSYTQETRVINYAHFTNTLHSETKQSGVLKSTLKLSHGWLSVLSQPRNSDNDRVSGLSLWHGLKLIHGEEAFKHEGRVHNATASFSIASIKSGYCASRNATCLSASFQSSSKTDRISSEPRMSVIYRIEQQCTDDLKP